MVTSVLARNLASLLADIDASRDFQACLTILRHLTSPRKDPQRDRVALRVDNHELKALLPQINRLARVEPETVYDLLESQLGQAERVSPTRELAMSDWWRSAVEVDPEYVWEQPGLNFLISAVRESLRELIGLRPDIAERKIISLLGSDDLIRERIGLWALTIHPSVIKHAEIPGLAGELTFDPATFHERMVLLNRRFGDLPDPLQRAIHHAIESGPPRRAGVTDDDHDQLVDWWRWRVLPVLPTEALTEQEVAWMAKLTSQRGSPPDPLFLRSQPVVSWGTPRGSIDLQAALLQGPSEAVSELQRAGDAWEQLRGDALQEPGRLTTLAPHFSEDDYPHLWTYFAGYAEALKQSDTPFSWTPLIGLAARVATAPLGSHDHVLVTMSWLLHDGLRQSKNPIPHDLMDQILAIATALLTERATPVDSGDAIDDLDKHQLNSAAGVAASLFMVWLWHALETDDGKLTRGWPLDTAARITAALEGAWGGIEMRYAMGEFAWLLEWCEPGWVAVHLTDVALRPAHSQSARAFSRGYLRSEHLDQRVMREMLGVHRSLITHVADNSVDHQDDLLSRKVIGHIVAGWSADLAGFDLEGLLGELHAALSDELRGEIARLMMLHLEAAEGQQRAELWTRMETYWTFVVERYREAEPVERSDELTWFCSWVAHVPAALADIEIRLYVSIDHVSRGFGLERLIDALAARAGTEPLSVARLMSRLVRRWSIDPEIQWYGRSLEQVIEGVWRSGNPEARDIAKVVVDELLKAGKGDFSSALASRQ